MKVIIDRFEDIYAICEKEDKTYMNILIEILPKDAREGDVLIVEESNIAVEKKETEINKKRILTKTSKIWK